MMQLTETRVIQGRASGPGELIQIRPGLLLNGLSGDQVPLAIVIVEAESGKLPHGQKDYRDVSLLRSSTTPASSKGRTKLRETHRDRPISGAFTPVLEKMPFRYPLLRASLVGLGSPGKDRSSHSTPSSPKTIHCGNS